jgi:hypothetical protein
MPILGQLRRIVSRRYLPEFLPRRQDDDLPKGMKNASLKQDAGLNWLDVHSQRFLRERIWIRSRTGPLRACSDLE